MSHGPHCKYPESFICMCELEPEKAPSTYHDILCPMRNNPCVPLSKGEGNVMVITAQEHFESEDRDCERCGEECLCTIIHLTRYDERRRMETKEKHPSNKHGKHEKTSDNEMVVYSYKNPGNWRAIKNG
jgi:hypothetical protein